MSATLDMDEIDLTSAESRTTYEEIKKYLAENFNLPKSEAASRLCVLRKKRMRIKALKTFKMI